MINEEQKPCPVCGSEERRSSGLLTCECSPLTREWISYALVCECGATDFENVEVAITSPEFGDAERVTKTFARCLKCGVISLPEEGEEKG